jgi:hypothetical protein
LIPNIIHFIYGLEKDFGGKPFSYIHYLAIKTAKVVNKPDIIYFHYQFEPKGVWWEQSKKYLTLNNIQPKTEIFGNKLEHFAHKSDVARLEILLKYGGIYLDIDVICINSFAPLLKYKCVLGREENVGLCNAVILAEQNSKFLQIWYENYKNFNGENWNEHSVKLPLRLAKKNPKLIHIENEYSFFYPMVNDPVENYLWYDSSNNSYWDKILFFLKKIKWKFKNLNKGFNYMPVFHELFSQEWHYHRLTQSYCMHLWESAWWERYLKDISSKYIKEECNHFSRIVKRIIEG